MVLALGALLDREQHPAAVGRALAERPVLREIAAVGCRPGVVHLVPGAIHDPVAERRLDADHDPIVAVIGAVRHPHVLDLWT